MARLTNTIFNRSDLGEAFAACEEESRKLKGLRVSALLLLESASTDVQWAAYEAKILEWAAQSIIVNAAGERFLALVAERRQVHEAHAEAAK